jgi:asparagine synthase (glutamine-hydrolysing)
MGHGRDREMLRGRKDNEKTVVHSQGLRQLAPETSIETPPLGGFCPYWTKQGGQIWVADCLNSILDTVPGESRPIDPVAVLELLQFNYMLGDRTLVDGIKRMPWRSRLTCDGKLIRRPPIPHGSECAPPKQAAQILQALLSEELRSATQDHQRVFVLLSGGLDSRIVAGILKKTESQINAPIVAVTWGQPLSRDVVYARRIAAWYGWQFIHIPYGPDLVWNNIETGALWGGSEVAGIHLHGTGWFQNTEKHDIAVAASFGDSIGRAEYSAIHLSKLELRPIANRHLLFYPSLASSTVGAAENDRRLAWEAQTSKEDWVLNELDMQENYMRRMICHAMDPIRQYCDLHQAFTSDQVVRFMWSLAPHCRVDEIYHRLLENLDPRLYSLPWPRTGRAPDGTHEKNEALQMEYHQLGKWLRRDLRPRLEELLFSDGLVELGLFDKQAIYRLWKRFLAEPETRLGSAEDVVKLASIELTRRYYGIQPHCGHRSWQDMLSDTAVNGLNAAKKWGKRIARMAR